MTFGRLRTKVDYKSRFQIIFVFVVVVVVSCYLLRSFTVDSVAPQIHRHVILEEGRAHIWNRTTCFQLLATGKLLMNDVWEPEGCYMLEYTTYHARKCFHRMSDEFGAAYLTFIGDSRMRTFVRNFIRLVNATSPLSEHIPQQKSTDINYYDNDIDLHLELIWSPYVKGMYEAFENIFESPVLRRPAIIISGAGLWYIKEEGIGSHNIKTIVEDIDGMKRRMLQLTRDSVVVWLITGPVKYQLLDSTRKNLTNDNIRWYNNVTRNILFEGNKVYGCESTRKVSYAYNVTYYDDGLHVSGKILEKQMQILLNYFCNPFLSNDPSVCCSRNGTEG